MSLDGEIRGSRYEQLLHMERRCLATIDLLNPRIDKIAAQTAIYEYLDVCRAEPRPLRWVPDTRTERASWLPVLYPAYVPMSPGAGWRPIDAAWQAGVLRRLERPPSLRPGALWKYYYSEMLECLDFPRRRRRGRMPDSDSLAADFWSGWTNREKVAEAAAPLLKAFAAGVFYLKIGPTEIICVPRPSLWILDGRLHREDGPAVLWPTGDCRHFWKGVHVPPVVIESPDTITPEQIRGQNNAEVRRCMIERFGIERFIHENGVLLGTDKCGRLWAFDDGAGADIPFTYLEVENGTLEPDGTRRRYFLHVPPWMESPRTAAAWTYGLTPEQYDLAVRT